MDLKYTSPSVKCMSVPELGVGMLGSSGFRELIVPIFNVTLLFSLIMRSVEMNPSSFQVPHCLPFSSEVTHFAAIICTGATKRICSGSFPGILIVGRVNGGNNFTLLRDLFVRKKKRNSGRNKCQRAPVTPRSDSHSHSREAA